MSKEPKRVPLAPRHRRNWWRWGRYCTCGLRWPCPDRLGGVPVMALPAHRNQRWTRSRALRRESTVGVSARGHAQGANGSHG
ncbi:hypothetical protein ACSNN7_26055 [Micromonospora sp. URMC 105]|uniref:hypothetical protein n=1 Tax=Micromonospora sp. URMC 105 TaxID=3423413 RepID=UPI003F1E25FB